MFIFWRCAIGHTIIGIGWLILQFKASQVYILCYRPQLLQTEEQPGSKVREVNTRPPNAIIRKEK